MSTSAATEPTFADRAPAPPAALDTVTPARRPDVLPPARQASAAAAAPAPLQALTSSESIGQLIAGLAAAQLAFTAIERTHTAKVDSKRTGVQYSYDYADLAGVLRAVRPALAQNGVAIVQAPQVRNNALVLTTFIAHSSGEWMRNDLAIGISGTDPQSIGSAITYARRYALQSLLGVAPEDDDDGAAASQPAAPAVQQPQRASQTNGNGHGRATVDEFLAPARQALHQPAPVVTVVGVEDKQKTDGTPFWRVSLSNGRQLVTNAKDIADRLIVWQREKRPLQADELVTHTQGSWTILDELQPAPAGAGS